MDTPTASRSSRLPLRTALIAVVATLALAGCSSSDSTAKSGDSTAAASEDAATNDVATSSEVSLTLDLQPSDLEQLMSEGSQIVIAREVQSEDGEVSQLVWLSLDEMMETNEITFDPNELSVVASNSPLEVGAAIDSANDVGITMGQTATWSNGQFDVTSGPSGSVSVVAGNDGPTVFGLAAPATVNGAQSSSPFVAMNIYPNQMSGFTPTGKLYVWVAQYGSNPGSVLGQPWPPTAATEIDTASQPDASYTYDSGTLQFVQNG